MSEYVLQPMFTYLGNKRKLLDGIERVVVDVKQRLGKDKIKVLDAFTGTTVVARMLAGHATEIHTNDLELYSWIASRCFLRQPNEQQKKDIERHIEVMNSMTQWKSGLITSMYAPKESSNVQLGERCFYTRENAMRLDTWRMYIDTHVDDELQDWVLCPVLIQMSIHANTMGHLKAFIKNKDGIGAFDGKRVTDPLRLEVPIWNPWPCQVHCHNVSTNVLVDALENDSLDLMYIDPPYNQHEYGAYYFLLNILAKYERPININAVTGLPKDRIKSDYNTEKGALKAMKHLIDRGLEVSKFLLISYNDEGIIKREQWDQLFTGLEVERIETDYSRYVATGTKKDCHKTVKELLYLVNKPPGRP
ncbi:DNA modification methylase [bacterium]|nr:DNA modification methylase [bacterium]